MPTSKDKRVRLNSENGPKSSCIHNQTPVRRDSHVWIWINQIHGGVSTVWDQRPIECHNVVTITIATWHLKVKNLTCRLLFLWILRGLSDKSCDSHIRALRISILSPLLWCSASQKQMTLFFKKIRATALNKIKIATVRKGGGVGGQQASSTKFFDPQKLIIFWILYFIYFKSQA